MASDEKFVSFICEQMADAGPISARKMFGEYAIYCGEKVVALVCDNQLFVKPTPGGRMLLGDAAEGAPYPGAKPHFLMDEGLDDREMLAQLIAVTVRELPEPKPKAPKKKASKKPATSRTGAKKATQSVKRGQTRRS